MAKEFVERRDGSFYLIGSDAPETIQSNFGTLSLEQVYGAITFYLGNKEEVEKDLIERRRIEDEFKLVPSRPWLRSHCDRTAAGEPSIFRHSK